MNRIIGESAPGSFLVELDGIQSVVPARALESLGLEMPSTTETSTDARIKHWRELVGERKATEIRAASKDSSYVVLDDGNEIVLPNVALAYVQRAPKNG